MSWKILWRCLFAVAIIMLVFFVVNYHFPFSGVKRITYDFKGPDGTVSHVYPVARVRDTGRADGRTYLSMIEDPVYVDVRTRVPYKNARIELIYQNKTSVSLKIGMKRADGDTAFELKALENGTQERGWTRGSATFDLSGASYYNSKYTFAFSVPGLRTEKTDAGELRLSRMILTLERDPLRFEELKKLLSL